MIPKKMLDALAAKYGGQAQAVVAMAETVAALKAAAEFQNFDFNDVCDVADEFTVKAKAAKLRPAPLLDVMGFDEADAFATGNQILPAAVPVKRLEKGEWRARA